MSILVAEDDKTSAKVFELTLKKYGYNFILAENGKVALHSLYESPHIRLIITDIMMPEMDGLELLQEIKKTRELQRIPIIMCTTKADIETVKKAVKSGCSDYIVKPINPLQLLKKIERVMENDTPVIVGYRDLVLKTRMDRYTYAELIKAFHPFLDEKIGMIQMHIEKQKPLLENALAELSEKASRIGAHRIHFLLEESKDLLNNKTGTPAEVFAEMRLVRREMKMLRYNLPK